jgi:serine/threonine protein kinase
MAWVRLGTHPNIIFAMWVFEAGGKPHLLMEYADGGDLHTWISQGRLTVPLAVSFAIQFCEGMRYAVHTAGMVHRDIKPANVLVKGNGIIKIADFGLAKAFDAEREIAGQHEPSPPDPLSRDAVGARPYMPPE